MITQEVCPHRRPAATWDMARRGVFPGSFNPMTIAHLAVARLARDAHDLDEVHLVVSRSALDKPEPPGPSLARRVELIEAELADLPWLSVRVTELQLIADIATGYDVVIMGADKWEQVNDERYYSSAEERDLAVARLPTVTVARRGDVAVADDVALETPEELRRVSSTGARQGHTDFMAPHASRHWRAET